MDLSRSEIRSVSGLQLLRSERRPNDSTLLIATVTRRGSGASVRYRRSWTVRMTRPTSRKATYVAFLCDPDRSRLSSVAEEMAPSRTEMATRVRCRTWDSIRSRSIEF
ncbi:predicted protein [Streptomyces iranensis]|uniref:Uncharacterized protein n=1 Tax=Streptomyces iranensis TaxID=576784 RepID=A0A060ZZ58_9ACTN|nr:predicted protein [Streptomyces iranensis]